jgi:Na+/H+ antiporter NhaD/arsenite permease-like protein
MGAVFFGAATYIGNSPNFMIKVIAERHKMRTPSFVGFVIKFSLPILLPVLLLICWLTLPG